MAYLTAKAIQEILKTLNPRQQEVLGARFGLAGDGREETLAEIGKRFGITRERVRQIEKAGITALARTLKDRKEWTAFFAKSKELIAEGGGVMRSDRFLDELGHLAPGIGERELGLVLEATQVFLSHPEDRSFYPFYYLSKEHLKQAQSFIEAWAKALAGKRNEALAGKYDEEWMRFLAARNVEQVRAENYASISKKFHVNPYGDRGLSAWAEIKPHTVRDKIYLVLKKETQPLHFQEITKRIETAGFGGRKTVAATVHNELIKDPRFVLVGRGMYGLAERGYEPGTAREVIQKILKTEGALRSEQVVLAVQKNRFFKPNTILVNLQNKSYFKRLSDGRYQTYES